MWKDSAEAAAVGNVNVSNPGTNTFDGVTLTNGQRLLLINQSAGAENGLWEFNGSSSALTRPNDFNDWDSEVVGAIVPVEDGGSVYGATVWVNTNSEGGTLGTTPITFTQWFIAYVGGTGVTINGNSISIGQAVATTDNVEFASVTGSTT